VCSAGDWNCERTHGAKIVDNYVASFPAVNDASVMAHFDALRWEINLEKYSAAELDSNPVVQAVFVHEYVHYAQALTGTIGRHILIEMARLAVFVGILRRHGWPPPAGYDQVNLREVLSAASKADLAGTEPERQFKDFLKQLQFATSDKRARMSKGTPPGTFVRHTLTVGPHSVDDFVHVTGDDAAGPCAIPITDRVVFENMARQVQRNFLLFNNELKTAPVDDERQKPNRDLEYVCLHDLVGQRLPKSEDNAKWTITLCQIALLCRNPGSAFEHLVDRLSGLRTVDLTSFVQAANRDEWFKGEFNKPPIQLVLNELVEKWGTAILPRENWELREFTKLIANACNALLGDYTLMASPLITWKDVGHWIARFGCPPIVLSEGPRHEIQGIKTSAPWISYFRRLADLLA